MNTRTRDTDVGVAISTGHHLHLGLDSPLSQSSPPSSGRRTVSLPAGAVQLRSFSYLVHSGINILIHGFQNPEQQEWDAYLTEMAPLVRRDRLRGVLVRSPGGGPDPQQRRQIVELYRGKSIPVANVSDSAVTRAITTAIGWFYKGTMRSFSPCDLPQALEYLSVPETQRQSMLQCVASMCAARGMS